MTVISGTTITGFRAQVISATDYSPFSAALSICDSEWLAMRTLSERVNGVAIPSVNTQNIDPRVDVGVVLAGRTYASGSGYRYGFNGMEKDSENFEGAYDFGARILDTRLGRWLSVDAAYPNYPSHSTYNYCVLNPVIFIDHDGNVVIDPETGDAVVVTFSADPNNPNGFAVNFQRANGKNLSDAFFRQCGPLLTNLGQSVVGQQLIQQMSNLPTKVELATSNAESGASSRITPERKRNGDFKRRSRDGLFKAVKIVVNLEKKAQSADKAGISQNEALVGVMTVEVGHISDKTQIDNDIALLDHGFGYAVWERAPTTEGNPKLTELENRKTLAKSAYESLFNKAAQAQIAWRVERSIQVTKTVYSVMDGAARINPTAFSEIGPTEETKQNYSANGGTD